MPINLTDEGLQAFEDLSDQDKSGLIDEMDDTDATELSKALVHRRATRGIEKAAKTFQGMQPPEAPVAPPESMLTAAPRRLATFKEDVLDPTIGRVGQAMKTAATEQMLGGMKRNVASTMRPPGVPGRYAPPPADEQVAAQLKKETMGFLPGMPETSLPDVAETVAGFGVEAPLMMTPLGMASRARGATTILGKVAQAAQRVGATALEGATGNVLAATLRPGESFGKAAKEGALFGGVLGAGVEAAPLLAKGAMAGAKAAKKLLAKAPQAPRIEPSLGPELIAALKKDALDQIASEVSGLEPTVISQKPVSVTKFPERPAITAFHLGPDGSPQMSPVHSAPQGVFTRGESIPATPEGIRKFKKLVRQGKAEWNMDPEFAKAHPQLADEMVRMDPEDVEFIQNRAYANWQGVGEPPRGPPTRSGRAPKAAPPEHVNAAYDYARAPSPDGAVVVREADGSIKIQPVNVADSFLPDEIPPVLKEPVTEVDVVQFPPAGRSTKTAVIHPLTREPVTELHEPTTAVNLRPSGLDAPAASGDLPNRWPEKNVQALSRRIEQDSDLRSEARKAYFKPGAIVEGYGGGRDKVLEYTPSTDRSGWSVKVIGVDRSGTPRMGESPRSHFTEPKSDRLAGALMSDRMETQLRSGVASNTDIETGGGNGGGLSAPLPPDPEALTQPGMADVMRVVRPRIGGGSGPPRPKQLPPGGGPQWLQRAEGGGIKKPPPPPPRPPIADGPPVPEMPIGPDPFTVHNVPNYTYDDLVAGIQKQLKTRPLGQRLKSQLLAGHQRGAADTASVVAGIQANQVIQKSSEDVRDALLKKFGTQFEGALDRQLNDLFLGRKSFHQGLLNIQNDFPGITDEARSLARNVFAEKEALDNYLQKVHGIIPNNLRWARENGLLDLYMTRRYLAFAMPKGEWVKRLVVPKNFDRLREGAQYLIQKRLLAGEPANIERVQEEILDLLRADNPLEAFKNSPRMSPLKSLLERGDIPQPIRRMLGEIESGISNIAITLGTQRSLVARLDLLAEIAANPRWASDVYNPHLGMTYKMGDSPAFGKLRNKYVGQEFAEALGNVQKMEGAQLQFIQNTLGFIKGNQVALGGIGPVINSTFGNLYSGVLAGGLDLTRPWKSGQAFAKSWHAISDYLDDPTGQKGLGWLVVEARRVTKRLATQQLGSSCVG